MSADDSRSLGAQPGGGEIIKTIVMVNADRRNMIAELPIGRSISSGDLLYVSKGKRLSDDIQYQSICWETLCQGSQSNRNDILVKRP